MFCSFHVPVGVWYLFFSSVGVCLCNLVPWFCASLWQLMGDARSPVHTALSAQAAGMVNATSQLLIRIFIFGVLKEWLTDPITNNGLCFPSLRQRKSRHGEIIHTQNTCEEGCFPHPSDGWAMLKVVFIQVRFISGSCFLPYLLNRAKKSSCLQESLCEGRSKVSWCPEGEWPPEALASPAFLAQLLWQGLWHMRLRKTRWICCVFSDVL